MYYDLINLYNAYQNEKTNREGARVVWTNRKQTFPPPAGFRDLSWDRDYIWSLHKYEICLSYEYLLCDKSILHMTWFLRMSTSWYNLTFFVMITSILATWEMS